MKYYRLNIQDITIERIYVLQVKALSINRVYVNVKMVI